MRVSLIGFGAFAAATVLAVACGDSRDATITDPAALATSQATCQFTIMPDLVRRYFSTADQATARALLAQMETFFKAGDFVQATDKGFDVLALIESATNAGRQIGSAQRGSLLTNAVLACMTVGQPTLPIDFSGALGAGGFAVRGGPADPTSAVLSRDSLSGVGIQESTWPAVFGERILLYGALNSNAIFNEVLVGSPFQWSTLPPNPVVNPGAVVGFCVDNPGQYRVEENHASTTHSILFLEDPSPFLACPNIAPLVPNALGPVGGSATGFSDFGPVDAGSINVSYPSQPSTVKAGRIIKPAVKVFVQGNGGTPLPEVTIEITLVTISGTGNLTGSLRKVTGTAGIETFNDLRVSQPGTYALLATTSAEGFATVVLQSNQFTVTP